MSTELISLLGGYMAALATIAVMTGIFWMFRDRGEVEIADAPDISREDWSALMHLLQDMGTRIEMLENREESKPINTNRKPPSNTPKKATNRRNSASNKN